MPVRLSAGGEPLEASLEVLPAEFPEKQLRVSRRFVERPPPRVQRRIEADRLAFERAFAQEPAAPLFEGRFAWPRRDVVNAGFGEVRTFNGKKESRHYGLDIGGDMGAPVAAAQAGRVALVRHCWASGLSVVLFHGAGLYSTYFHLSRAEVQAGQEVARGQVIGRVGKSGRVTGPHLHWGVKVGDRYVDPESVLRLPF
jgi:murein DD-endopeptidase MepM/ murein hydrolase activator NlpD